MDIAPIKSNADHEAALARIAELMELDPDVDTRQGDELDILVTLVSAFEDEHHPIDAPDPIEAIHFAMDQQGLSRKDLEPLIGSRGRVSEILNRHRALSMTMVRKLSTGLHIPASVLIREYELQG